MNSELEIRRQLNELRAVYIDDMDKAIDLADQALALFVAEKKERERGENLYSEIVESWRQIADEQAMGWNAAKERIASLEIGLCAAIERLKGGDVVASLAIMSEMLARGESER